MSLANFPFKSNFTGPRLLMRLARFIPSSMYGAIDVLKSFAEIVFIYLPNFLNVALKVQLNMESYKLVTGGIRPWEETHRSLYISSPLQYFHSIQNPTLDD